MLKPVHSSALLNEPQRPEKGCPQTCLGVTARAPPRQQVLPSVERQ